jgi:hypothetical protein
MNFGWQKIKRSKMKMKIGWDAKCDQSLQLVLI